MEEHNKLVVKKVRQLLVSFAGLTAMDPTTMTGKDMNCLEMSIIILCQAGIQDLHALH